jgi:heat shock protein HslJ
VSRPPTLAGSSWRVVSIAGRPLPAVPDVTLAFTASDVSGAGGCNSFGGTYTFDPATGALRFGPLISTKRACVEAARNEVEAAYFTALRDVASARIDPDGRLSLLGSGAELILAVGPQADGGPAASGE